jgi:glycosyltransferase involved in cell wall biosynthesis
MVAKFKRIPIVATYHCVIASYKKNSINGVFLNIYNSLNIKLIRLIDHLIFTTKDYSKLFNFPKSKVSIIPIGVETDRFKPFNRTLSRKIINLPKDKFIILFVGNIDIHNYCKKGVEYLLKAIPLIRNYIPNVFLDLVGTTDIESKQIIDNISKKERITDIVHISGYVKSENLPVHYTSSNIFVLPSVSRLEAFGIVLIEALASGIPIIATNITGVRSVVRSSKAGFLIEPGSINDIVKKVVTVSRLKNLDNFAIKTVKNKYEWATIVKNILDIYKSLIYLK